MIKPGMFINERYEIISKIGSGGMADVYKAKCHRLNRFVAIKVLKPEYSNDTSFVSKFRGEAQSAACLSHPNIVGVHDVGEEEGLYFIVMEFVEGITLKSFIERKGKLSIREAIGISIQIAQGLEAAHSHHIIHRDIKPQNIMISKDGKVKVTDFGIAKAATSQTITSNAMGSVHYISPEQARGGFSDERSDIYSLGVTMYEMICGQVPFSGDNTVSVALLHIEEEPTPLKELEPSLPISAEKIIQKCMQKKPERRYSSATELIADLKRALVEPNEDFVKVIPPITNDSPTINFTQDELNQIKSAKNDNENINESVKLDSDIIQKDTKSINEDNELDESEEDSSKEVNPKLEKFLVAGSIIVAIILACIVIAFIGRAFGIFTFFNGSNNHNNLNNNINKEIDGNTNNTDKDNQDKILDEDNVDSKLVTLPDVIDFSVESATKILENVEMKYEIEERETSSVEAGKVLNQEPLGKTKVATGTVVKLTVSKKPDEKTLIVPKVYEYSAEEAKRTIEEVGFTTTYSYQDSDTIQKGYVISTSPVSGTSAVEGSLVTIIVSNGPKEEINDNPEDIQKPEPPEDNNDNTITVETTTVPNVIGMTESSARSTLTSKEISVEVSYESSETTDKGKVMYQNPVSQTVLEKWATVKITISTGPKEPDIPNIPEPDTPEPDTPEPDIPDTPSYKYVGNLSLGEAANPFMDDMESGNITIDIEQDGAVWTVYNNTLSGSDFSINVSIDGKSDSPGIAKMYLNDSLCGQWTINFEKVEN